MILLIKLSGKVLEEQELRPSLSRQIGELVGQGHRIVVVHGGGKQVSELSSRLAVPVIQYEGRRVTDELTLEVAKMVLSSINREVTASLMGSGVNAVGISSFDGKLACCRKRPPIPVKVNGKTRVVDFGFVAEIDHINPFFIFQMWELGLVPVVSCLCADARGQILNINADTLASEMAVALHAAQLISVSDVEGIYLDLKDPSTRIPELSITEARDYLRDGRFSDGMIPKIEVALEALERGVKSVQIVSGLTPNGVVDGVKGKGGTRLHQTASGGRSSARSCSSA